MMDTFEPGTSGLIIDRGGSSLRVVASYVDRQAAQAIVDAAHQVCPYSHATRGNIDVTITVV